MLHWVLDTAPLLQTLFQRLVSLKYFNSFKVAFRVPDLEKDIILKKKLIRKIEKKW